VPCIAFAPTGPRSRGLVPHRLDVLAVLEHGAECLLDDLGVDLLAAERSQRLRPVDRLGDPGWLREVETPEPPDERRGLAGELLGDPRDPQPDDLDLAIDRRVPDPVEEGAPLERVVELPGSVGREDDGGPSSCPHGSELRDRDLEVRQDLQEERLELLVRAVDLVDEQHDRVVGVDRLEEWPPDEVLGAEELGLGHGSLLRGADVQQLPRVVPLVDGVGDVEALVALEPDQARLESGGERLGRLRLADPGLPLEQERLLERERQEQRRREPAIREVVRLAERRLEVVDGAEGHRRSVPPRRTIDR
jgi:hypothetical protein